MIAFKLNPEEVQAGNGAGAVSLERGHRPVLAIFCRGPGLYQYAQSLTDDHGLAFL